MKTKMKTLLAVLILSSVGFYGCDFDNWADPYDTTPPSAPKNVSVLNGDNRVDIFWDRNRESDVAGYNVYFSYSYDGRYELIGSTSGTSFADFGARNGTTYYYAVTAYDFDANESELSRDNVYITPRPEGFNQSIFDYKRFPNSSGYDFSEYRVVAFDAQNCDFYFENHQGNYYLNVYDDTDIQDMGPTYDLYDIPYAPNAGWAASKSVRAVKGHTYVIWTFDNHFAKVRISQITPDRIVFDWSYQTVKGNVDLKPVKQGERKLELKTK